MAQIACTAQADNKSIQIGLFLAMMMVIDFGPKLTNVWGLPASVLLTLVLLSLSMTAFLSKLSERTALSQKSFERIVFVVSEFYLVLNAIELGNVRNVNFLLLILGGAVALLWLAKNTMFAQYKALVFLFFVIMIFIGIRALAVHGTKIGCIGDMLPLVQSALQSFAQGEPAYKTHFVPWPLPLTYLPLCWLSYWPAYRLHQDIRIINVLSELLLLIPMIWFSLPIHNKFSNCSAAHTGKRSFNIEAICKFLQSPGAVTAVLIWTVCVLRPTATLWTLANTHAIFWLLLSIVYVLNSRGHLKLAAVVLGITLSESLLVNVALVFFALNWWRRVGFLRAASLCFLSAMVSIVVIAPFYLQSPQGFVFGVWRWHNDLSLALRDGWVSERIWEKEIGFAGIFWQLEIERWMKPIQGTVILILGGVYWIMGAQLRHLGAFLSFAYIVFMCFNPMNWSYLYWPGVLVGLLSITEQPVKTSKQEVIAAP